MCFQCIRVGTRINGNFDCPVRDILTISQEQIEQLPLNRIDCLQKMNSSFRNSSIVVNSSTVLAQAILVMLIFNQE